MAILKKGNKISLKKAGLGAVKVLAIDLCWNPRGGGTDFDLDLSVFALNGSGVVMNEDWFVFFGNPASPRNAILTSGDERKGGTETITVEAEKLIPQIAKLAVIANIDEAEERGQNFGMVQGAYLRVYDPKNPTGPEVRFDLNTEYGNETGILFGEILVGDGDLEFSAIGAPLANGLYTACENYGVEVTG